MNAPWRQILPLPDAAATQALGQLLAPLLRAGDVVALRGDLGAGKTALARGIIQGLLGLECNVPSPTFTLVQHYNAPGNLLVAHYDWYRIKQAEEVWDLGFEDDLARAVTLVEWPERAPQCLPPRTLTIAFQDGQGAGRLLALSGVSTWAARLSGLTSCLVVKPA